VLSTVQGEAVRATALLFVVGLLVASCGGEDLGDMTSAEAEQACLDRASDVVTPDQVTKAVTHKDDRYWDVLLDVDPPHNLVWCTFNAVNGDMLHFSHGYTRRAAEKSLNGGLWENSQ
jgi:hypothetical protein